MQSIQQTCYWLATSPRSPAPTLQGEHRTDIAVVGAGLTGLWTALFIKELAPPVQVVVVEQGVAGYGASGRNAGILSETIDHSHQAAIRHFGLSEARTLAGLGQENLVELFAWLQSRRIDCEFEPSGRLLVALTPAQLQDCERTVETAQRLGVAGYRFLDAARTREELDSSLYLGGALTAQGGILNPVKLVNGLRREAERLGVRIYERSRVTHLGRQGSRVTLVTEAGRLTAGKAVLATSAYSHQLLPRLSARFIPLYDYVLVSEPLTPAQRAVLGWKRRQGVTDGRTFFNYYRLTADDRVLWGTSEAAYYRGNRVDSSCDHSERHYAALRESFRRHFPALGSLSFPYAWGGAICSSTRLTPFFGSAMQDRVRYALGYTGHGLGSTRLAGKVLAHQALDRPTPLLDLSLVRRKPFPYPPEPFRGYVVNAVTRALRQVDAGNRPNLLLRMLDAMGIGFSS